MIIKKSLLVLSFLALLCVIKEMRIMPDTSFQLYILIGQSNMAGRGLITDKFKTDTNVRVFMLNKSKEWVLARHPIHFDKPGIAGVGPGLAFGISMAKADPNVKIGLIPCAVGGTPIEHWIPGAYDEPTKTHPYDDALVRIKAGMQSGVVKGVIWHQGESDCTPEQMKAYTGNLKVLIQRIRAEVGDPSLPFIIGELGQYRPVYLEMNQVLAKVPASVPNTALVSSAGLVHKGDTTHFNAMSAEELGKRFAFKMQKVQQVIKNNAH